MKALANGGTREFALTLSPLPGNRLPKRAGTTDVIVDGTPTKAPVTTNKGWAKDPSLVLAYIWVTAADGKSYYLTLDYAEPASAVTDLSIVEGTGPKPVARVTAKPELEAARIAKFKASWEARP
jgi:hypothetical protein